MANKNLKRIFLFTNNNLTALRLTPFFILTQRKITFPLLLFFLIFSLHCHTKEKEKRRVILKHVDSYQRETILNLFQRIISLSPAITESFFIDSEENY